MVWSFSPLIPGYHGCAIKNLFTLGQIIWLPLCLGDTEHKSSRHNFYLTLTKLSLIAIVII